ncbi:MAG: type II toxin-antitoxin system prevent-host-death family antitoxin [Bacillati bacterium ANGP1]|uniref:Type II toxin-antitoxin system prevent-host-death family antitoxin n=1 Tax=Candidatus Segetimicrobium genomatis TaxID=2569760 RepID=A0A537J6I2_9BACT|nr:MAG: type II toxin-antitoxin system prevent-host-death family antitoxin [Terrabacteria group bacterium ANGP1]
MGTVTAKQLKNRTGDVLRRVRSGEVVTVTVRGTSVAQFVPLSRKARVQRMRDTRASMRATVRSIAGRYRGLGTVQEFLAEKAREITQER